MTDDRSLDRAARSWLEEGPTRAPDHAVEAALARIQTTSQERDLRVPWRLPTMNPIVRLAGAALVVLVGAGVLMLALRQGPDVASAPTPPLPSATPSPARSTPARPIADGTYAAEPIPVAEIVDRLESDPDLNADARAAVTNNILMLERGGTHLHVRMEVTGDRMILRYGTDEENFVQEDPWSLYVLDATTIALGRNQGNPVIQAWRITQTPEGFTMSAVSPPTDPVEAFVRSVIFETAAFSAVP